jgi:hypothetical protein
MGRHKYIETPERLWELFLAYKKEVKSNPILVKDWVGKDAEEVHREREKPLTMVGFECFVLGHTEITYPDLTHYFENKDNRYSDFIPISSRIKSEIKNDQVTGGMTMIYSQNLTARLNNLVEKTEDVTPQQPKKLVIKIKRDEDI